MTSKLAAPVDVAVPTPNVVGVEYIPAVNAEPGAKPEPERVTVPPATVDPVTVAGPFDVGRVGGSSGAETMVRTIGVAVGMHVVSTRAGPPSLKTTLLTVTEVGAPETVPDIVVPGTFVRGPSAPYGVALTLTDAAPTVMVPNACNSPGVIGIGPVFGPSSKATFNFVPVTDALHLVVHGTTEVRVVHESVPDTPGTGVPVGAGEVVVGAGVVVVGAGVVVVGAGVVVVGVAVEVPAATVMLFAIGVTTGVVNGLAPGVAT